MTNLLVVGDDGVGKTYYIDRLKQVLEYEDHHEENMVSIYHPFLGNVHVYDSAVMYDIYDCAIIMCTKTSFNIQDYKNMIREKNGDIPIMILFNKHELGSVREQYQIYLDQNPADMVRYCSVNDQTEPTFREIVELTLP